VQRRLYSGRTSLEIIVRSISSQSPIQGVVFDFGSTLSITHASWSTIIVQGGTAIGERLREAGLSLPDDFAAQWAAMLRSSVRQAETDGIERSAEVVLAMLLASQGHDDLSSELIRRATDRYFTVEDGLRAPATGAAVLLSELKAAGYRVGILSNTIGGHWVQHWTDTHGFRPYVDAVVVSDEIGIRKPRPEIFLTTLERLRIDDPARAVMVGDTLAHDIVGAQRVGMRTVLVALAEDQGFVSQSATGERTILARPGVDATVRADAEITDLAALASILERWQGDGG
jgi:HAD superfamily hydrolase (TIGR01509 family)